jgi:hypothetical protein
MEAKRTKPAKPEKATLDFETFVRAAMATGKPPKAKAKKRKAKK